MLRQFLKTTYKQWHLTKQLFLLYNICKVQVYFTKQDNLLNTEWKSVHIWHENNPSR